MHFNNFETPYSKKNIIINIKKLFSTREWLDDNNNLVAELNNMYDDCPPVAIEPRVEEIDTADIEGDSLAFDTIQFHYYLLASLYSSSNFLFSLLFILKS
ncbi:hypothetical protein BFL38_12365 [Brachyspira hampsonii]|uniref:Uncharacterized protein n=1 Tax=Brachyspira hampsonii TaxID=1287055 RepID=A0A1E5NH97_9SPIR|nr:hypothetical protein BFL38_12365 [Brachyspira hampsonii]